MKLKQGDDEKKKRKRTKLMGIYIELSKEKKCNHWPLDLQAKKKRIQAIRLLSNDPMA